MNSCPELYCLEVLCFVLRLYWNVSCLLCVGDREHETKPLSHGINLATVFFLEKIQLDFILDNQNWFMYDVLIG